MGQAKDANGVVWNTDANGKWDGGPPVSGSSHSAILPAKVDRPHRVESNIDYIVNPDGSVTPRKGGPKDPKAIGENQTLSPEALDAETTNWIMTGKMSPLGMGGGPLRVQIQNNRPILMKRYGITENQLPAIQRRFKADSDAYEQRVKQGSFIQQAEQGALAHAEQIRGYLKQMPGQASMKAWNALSSGAQRQFSGETVTNLDTTLPLLKAEIAKIMTANPSGSGQLTDAARSEFNVLEGNTAPNRKIKALDALLKMARAKVKANDDEGQRLSDRMTGGLPSYAAGGSPGGNTPAGLLANHDKGTGDPTIPAGDTKFDAVKSAPIDRAIRAGMSYDQALKAGVFSPTSKPGAGERAHWNQLVAYAAKYPDHKGSYADIEVPTNTWNRIMNTGPGIGAANLFNTASGGLPIDMSGDTGRLALDTGNAAHPNYAAGGQIGGFALGSYGLGKALKGLGVIKNAAAPLVDGIEAVPGWLARTANFARNASPDLIMGGANGASANPDHPWLGAAEGVGAAAVGTAAGRTIVAPALRVAAETAPGQAVASAGMRAAQGFNDARGGGAGVIPSSLNGLRQAATRQGAGFVPTEALDAGQQILANTGALAPDDVAAIRGQLQDAQRLNFPMTLADTDPRLRMAAGSASRLSPDVRALAENTLIPRAAGRTGRAVRMINDHLAPTGNIADIQATNKLAAQQAGKPFYDAAMQAPPVDDAALNELLNTPGGMAAAKQGYTNALNKQTAPGDLSMSIDPATGQPRFDARLNWRTLQNIKMGMDNNLEPFRNPITGKIKIEPGSPADALDRLRGAYRVRLGELNPDYAAGNAAYAKVRGMGNASQQGYDLAGKMATMNPAEVGNIARGVSPEHLPHFQKGAASKLADRAVNTESDPYAFINGPDGAQQRLQSIFPEGAPQIGIANRMEDQFGATRTELTSGSQTEPRRAADKIFKASLGGGALADALAMHFGMPPIATASALGIGAARKAVQDAGTRSAIRAADAVGPRLLNTDPLANLNAIDEIIRQNAARQAYISRFRGMGGALGAPAAIPLIYGSGQ